MKNAAAATMAITPTMGRTVARATLPPWLKPELLEGVAPPDDCVWVADTAGVVEAAGVGAGAGGAAATHMLSVADTQPCGANLKNPGS